MEGRFEFTPVRLVPLGRDPDSDVLANMCRATTQWPGFSLARAVCADTARNVRISLGVYDDLKHMSGFQAAGPMSGLFIASLATS